MGKALKFNPSLVWVLWIVLTIFLCPPLPVHAVTEKDISYLTEEYPPFNFREHGELKGIAVDLLAEIFKRTESGPARDDIRLIPWERGYKRVLEKPNTMLFSMTRTEEREKLFKWVGPIAENRIVLIGLKDSKVVVNSAEDLKKYIYGVVRNDIGQQILLRAGVPPSNVDPVLNVAFNIRKLKDRRIDAWAYGEIVARWFIKKRGYDPSDFRTLHVLMEKGGLYYAFHKDTPDDLILKLQRALDSLRQSEGLEKSAYEKIVDKYLE